MVLASVAFVLLLCLTVAWQDQAAAEAGAEGQVVLTTAEKAVAAVSGSAPAHAARGKALIAIGKNAQTEAARLRSLPPRPPRIAPIAVNRIVGAYWYPHWGDPSRAAPRLAWSEAVYTPTLGHYDANDSRVVDQHIKMAVEHGDRIRVAVHLEGLVDEVDDDVLGDAGPGIEGTITPSRSSTPSSSSRTPASTMRWCSCSRSRRISRPRVSTLAAMEATGT